MAKHMLPDPDPTSVSEARAYRREKLLEAARKQFPNQSKPLGYYSVYLRELALDYAADSDYWQARKCRERAELCEEMADELEVSDD